MTKKLFLNQLEKKYKISYLHNPKHFNMNTLYIENMSDGRKVLCARTWRKQPHYNKLALLSPLEKKIKQGNSLAHSTLVQAMEASIKKIKEKETKGKVFGGLFQD